MSYLVLHSLRALLSFIGRSGHLHFDSWISSKAKSFVFLFPFVDYCNMYVVVKQLNRTVLFCIRTSSFMSKTRKVKQSCSMPPFSHMGIVSV